MKFFKKVIKNQDSLAKPVLLNFNQKGNYYKTMVGGTVSIIIKIAILAFTISKITDMVNLSSKTYSKIEINHENINLNQIFEKIQMPYFMLVKISDEGEEIPFEYNKKEFERNVDIMLKSTSGSLK